MAIFLYSQVKSTSINFNVLLDVLHFDIGSAGEVEVRVSGTSLLLKLGGEWVTLLNSNRSALTTANVTFADGSQLLIGDNTTGVSADGSANDLRGLAGNDRLIGLAGNDYLDGREGSDTYVVTGTSDGTDKYRDSGSSGFDRIVAGANSAVINLGTGFSNSLTGIEGISAESFTGVKVQGSSGIDNLNFTGVSLSGVTLIDAMAGADTVTGSAGDDKIKGGTDNDLINGAGGRDTAVFSGLRASYTVTNLGADRLPSRTMMPLPTATTASIPCDMSSCCSLPMWWST